MSPFARALADEIAAHGPMPFSRWMARCNAHYYATRDPLGHDFTTAPEIGQVFGELVGLWAADLWARAGSSPRVALVELGPGRGTLMADALRATARVPGFAAACAVHFVETSPVLRAAQAARVDGALWHDRVETLPVDVPLIVIANEFLDALPVRVRVRTPGGWRERAVAVADGAFVFDPSGIETVEDCFEALALTTTLATRVARQQGAVIYIDYGPISGPPSNTVQAIGRSTPLPPLANPGEADLTAHVDFAAIALAARPHARLHGPTTQGQFLARLGIAERTHALARANPAQAAALHAAAARLTAPPQMGALFKVLAFTHPAWPTPAGFAA